MLIGYQANDINCKCKIVKHVDRIWVDDVGNALIMRKFFIEVKQDSKAKLESVNMSLPVSNIFDLEDYSESGLDKDNFFNQRFTGGELEVVKLPEPLTQPFPFGLVNADGIHNIRVYTENAPANYSAVSIGKGSRIFYRFPEPVNPGDTVQVILAFKTNLVCSDMSAGPRSSKVFWISLPYFTTRKEYTELLSLIQGKPFIPVCKYVKEIPGEERPKYVGGFDIFLYLYPNFFPRSDTFSYDYRIQPDTRLIDGAEGQKRNKLIWRLRYLDKDKQSIEFITGECPEILIKGVIMSPEPTIQTIQNIEDKLITTSDTLSQTTTKIREDLKDISDQWSRTHREISQSLTSTTRELNDTAKMSKDIAAGGRTTYKLAILALIVTTLGIITTVILSSLR